MIKNDAIYSYIYSEPIHFSYGLNLLFRVALLLHSGRKSPLYLHSAVGNKITNLIAQSVADRGLGRRRGRRGGRGGPRGRREELGQRLGHRRGPRGRRHVEPGRR